MKRFILAAVINLAVLTPAWGQDVNGALQIMREVAESCPRAYMNAHRDENQHPEAWDYVILATQALKKFDPAFGMNGKRGDVNNPSSDALVYRTPSGIRIIDFLIGAGEHGNDTGRLAWTDVTAESTVGGRVMGAYIDPDSKSPVVACGAEPPPPPPPTDGLQAVLDAIARLEAKVSELAGKVSELSGDLLDREFVITSIEGFKTQLAALEKWADTIHSQVLVGNDLQRQQLANPPEYKGRVFGFGVTLRPAPKE